MAETRVEGARAEWRRFREGTAGRRFVDRYERRSNASGSARLWWRVAYIAGAILLVCIGLVLAVMPGPAVLFYAMGALLLASVSRWFAERLDRLEVWSRRWIARLCAAWRERRGK